MEYKRKRALTREFLLRILKKYKLTDYNLKGSWKANDFHLSIEGNTSYSDVDILIKGIDEIKRKALMEKINHDFSEYFDNPISVSIHSGNSLYQMNIFDAHILGVAEYIAQYRKIQINSFCSKDYIDAKFTLLLLRKSFDERYQDIAEKIGTIEAKRALDVKLGKKRKFPYEYAKSLIHKFGTPTAVQFLNNCLLNKPNDDTAKSILSQLSRCKTIDQWLYNHLVNKIKLI